MNPFISISGDEYQNQRWSNINLDRATKETHVGPVQDIPFISSEEFEQSTEKKGAHFKNVSNFKNVLNLKNVSN